MNNVFGIDFNVYKKIILRRILLCVFSFIILVVLNLFFLFFRHQMGKILSCIINITIDILGLSIILFYYDSKISKNLILIKLYKQKKYVFSGMIDEISKKTIIYNNLECYVLNVDNKKYYSPVDSKIDFILHKNSIITIVKEIILEVSYE